MCLPILKLDKGVPMIFKQAGSIALGAGLLLAPLLAQAQIGVIQDTTELAKVLNYTPIPGPQVARQVCTPVTVYETVPANGNVASSIAGGVLGAVVGSRFGGGHGRDAATVVGAIGGTMIGNNMGSGSATTTRATTQQQCQTVYESGAVVGYQVTYDYKGKLYTTNLPNPPGEYLRIRNRVTVE